MLRAASIGDGEGKEQAVANTAISTTNNDSGANIDSLILGLQRTILTLREEHGIVIVVLGKDARVVTLEQHSDGAKEAADRPKTAGCSHGGRRLWSLGSLVSHERSDVILKVNQHGPTPTYLYACSEGLRQFSDFFDALFRHDFVESHGRAEPALLSRCSSRPSTTSTRAWSPGPYCRTV